MTLEEFRKHIGLTPEGAKFHESGLCRALISVLDDEYKKMGLMGSRYTIDHVQGYNHCQRILEQCFEAPRPTFKDIQATYGAPEPQTTKREKQ
jgi:hypothetical protein